jgi:hypothetical protein
LAASGGFAASVDGFAFSPPLDSHVGSHDFNTFMRDSVNAYMAALLLRASPDRSGVMVSGRPRSVFEGNENDDLTELPPWQERLRDIFQLNIGRPGDWGEAGDTDLRAQMDWLEPSTRDRCFGTQGQEKVYGARKKDASVWRQQIMSNAINACSLDKLVPDRENLGLVGERGFQGKVLQAALGGGDGKLSTVKLAEAYARIITNRRVRATLLPINDRQLTPGRPEESPLFARWLHEKLLTALEQPLLPLGTARRFAAEPLRRSLLTGLPRENLVLYAKTGTPTAVPLAALTALKDMIDILEREGQQS